MWLRPEYVSLLINVMTKRSLFIGELNSHFRLIIFDMNVNRKNTTVSFRPEDQCVLGCLELTLTVSAALPIT